MNFDLRAKEETGREGKARPLAHSHTKRIRPFSNISCLLPSVDELAWLLSALGHEGVPGCLSSRFCSDH